MLSMISSRKKAVIAAGVVMGLGASVLVMPVVLRPSHAAVAVFDAENIAKAIEMVAHTLNIQNLNLDQLILQKINMKHLPDETKEKLDQNDKEAKQGITWADTSNAAQNAEILKKMGLSPSILNKTTTPADILKNQMGDLGKIFKQGEVPIMHEMAQNNAKALDASFVDAATAARGVQKSDDAISKSVDEAVKAAASAEGDMQVQQSLVALSAANVRATENSNRLLAQLVATQSQKGYADNLEKAAVEQLEEVSRQKLTEWVKNW